MMNLALRCFGNLGSTYLKQGQKYSSIFTRCGWGKKDEQVNWLYNIFSHLCRRGHENLQASTEWKPIVNTDLLGCVDALHVRFGQVWALQCLLPVLLVAVEDLGLQVDAHRLCVPRSVDTHRQTQVTGHRSAQRSSKRYSFMIFMRTQQATYVTLLQWWSVTLQFSEKHFRWLTWRKL